jgi:hypothetical protein
MEKLLFAAMTAFGRAFGITFLFAATGLLAAPNLDAARSLSWAALAASLVAGFRAVQVFVPQITFAKIVAQPYAAWLDSAVRSGVAAFITGITGWLASPDLSTWKAALLGIGVGVGTAIVRALQGLLTPSDSPKPGTGLTVPEPVTAPTK